MYKNTNLPIRLACGFIIFSGIFSALWRNNYIKSIDRKEKKEFMEIIERDTRNDSVELCILKGIVFYSCKEKYKSNQSPYIDKKN
tara:strand:- start:198 stop:452 length:255 start_codon:yes stop_codon:yes gene_type:complete